MAQRIPDRCSVEPIESKLDAGVILRIGRNTLSPDEVAAVNRRNLSPPGRTANHRSPSVAVTTPSTRVGRCPLAGETEKREYELVGILVDAGESGNGWKFITNRCQEARRAVNRWKCLDWAQTPDRHGRKSLEEVVPP